MEQKCNHAENVIDETDLKNISGGFNQNHEISGQEIRGYVNNTDEKDHDQAVRIVGSLS